MTMGIKKKMIIHISSSYESTNRLKCIGKHWQEKFRGLCLSSVLCHSIVLCRGLLAANKPSDLFDHANCAFINCLRNSNSTIMCCGSIFEEEQDVSKFLFRI